MNQDYQNKTKLFSITKKDLEIQTFKSGGAGGQHQNKTDSGVRIIHKESGAVGECRNSKSQHRNKRDALIRLTKNYKFKLWVDRKAQEISTGETIDEIVKEQMAPDLLKFEIKNSENKWELIND